MSGRADPARAQWAGEADERGPRLEGVPADGGADGDVRATDADTPTASTGAPGGEGATPAPTETAGTETAGTETAGTETAGTETAGTETAGTFEEVILADVAALTAQRDEYLDALQRLKADFDNYRKRVARLQEEQASRAAADLVGKLLPVLDNLDLACAHLGAEEAGGEEARALGQARRQLLDVLAKEGLERVDAVDVPFDPTVHDAVAHAPAAHDGEEPEGAMSTGGEHAVDEVMRAGYRWRGQVVRPAMVRVRG